MAYSARLDEAFRFAHAVHAGHIRKGSGAPYITHPMAVAALIGEYGGSEDEVIAALLHDAVEDGEGYVTLEAIRVQFGETVATLVTLCSDAFETPKPPWRARKQAFIDQMRTAPDPVKRIVTADKTHNVRSVLRDIEALGPAVWDRFRGGRDGSIWYYQQILMALSEGWSHPLLGELASLVERLAVYGPPTAPDADHA